ncbi:MAG: DNA replication/repair protein RecF [Fimbriimonadaceae bacterium]
METASGDLAFRVESVRLEGFRNYDLAEVSLGEGLNVVFGENAQGKTNFLEAVNLAATSRLLRGFRDAEAIGSGRDHYDVRVVLSGTRTEIGMRMERSSRKRAFLNGVALPRAADVLGRLPCTCVSSADLAVVCGEPSNRRLFLDLEICQFFPAYLGHLSNYKRALEQRNALLKLSRDSPQPETAFEVWEAPMARHGAAMRRFRIDWTSRLQRHAEAVHGAMGSGEALTLVYETKDSSADEVSAARLLAQRRREDIARGTTTSGPHRDDLRIEVAGREARLFGSQGQQRTAAIALKLATLCAGREEIGAMPLLLLDDVFSDLDAGRRERMSAWVLEHASQAILTCTEPEAAGEGILRRARLFRVERGTIGPI